MELFCPIVDRITVRIVGYIHQGMADQITAALTTLKKSKFRSRFKLSDKDYQYIQTKGIGTVRSHAVDFISTRLAPALPKNDGKQTPMKGHHVFIASMRQPHTVADVYGKCIGFKKGGRLMMMKSSWWWSWL